MESTTPQKKSSMQLSIFAALAGMLITFIGGVYVGLHPSWIPIKGTGADSGTPSLMTSPATKPADAHPVIVPPTQP